jgi:DNA-binding NtrC family response regulator
MEFESHAQEVLHAKVAILDINLGPDAPDGVDAFNWLMDHGFQGKIVFLTGHARTNPRVALAGSKGVEVFEKPLHPDKLISFVTRALNGTL